MEKVTTEMNSGKDSKATRRSKVENGQYAVGKNGSPGNSKDSDRFVDKGRGRDQAVMTRSKPVIQRHHTSKKDSQIKIADFIATALIEGTTHKPENQLTAFEKMSIIEKGISKKGLEQLKAKTALDYDRLANMLTTTKATLINKKGDEKFNISLSERILSVADVYAYGYEVFEDVERFNRWVLSPIRALGGKAPYEIMDNQFGREEVRDIIGRIEYGVYS